MPNWAGKWKGGRYYLDEAGRPVYFIERLRRSVKLKTHDEELAVGDLARFLLDPVAFCRKPDQEAEDVPVHITPERIRLYLASIRKTVKDHRAARESQLLAWANYRGPDRKPLDLRTATKKDLREALASFEGGFRGRTETLNAFANFLVEERDQGLPSWATLVNPFDSDATRAERRAYALEELREKYAALVASANAGEVNTRLPGACHPRTPDVFLLRAGTGMHHTEIEQLHGAPIYNGPLPDKGAGIRILGEGHEIRAVLQVKHKSRHRFRKSVDAVLLAAALRIREQGAPSRTAMLEAVKPLVPSNLRHTYVTLCGEVGRTVSYTGAGVDLATVARAVGHRAGSTMTADRYDKLQVPPMTVIPLGFGQI